MTAGRHRDEPQRLGGFKPQHVLRHVHMHALLRHAALLCPCAWLAGRKLKPLRWARRRRNGKANAAKTRDGKPADHPAGRFRWRGPQLKNASAGLRKVQLLYNCMLLLGDDVLMNPVKPPHNIM